MKKAIRVFIAHYYKTLLSITGRTDPFRNPFFMLYSLYKQVCKRSKHCNQLK